MSEDKERDENDFADPPDQTGGGGRTDSSETEKDADPPDQTGGGGQTGG